VIQQLAPRIVFFPDFFFIGNHGMNSFVALPANIHPLTKLFLGISFFEPLVSMNGLRDEVVKVVNWITTTKLT